MAQNATILHTTAPIFSARFARRLLADPTFIDVFTGEV